MKTNYIALLDGHIDSLCRVLAAFRANDKNAIEFLNKAKLALGARHQAQDEWGSEYYEPAVYNALATISEAIEQNEYNEQLEACIIAAKNELTMIRDHLIQIS
ncbi:MAG: hypothetical protein Q4C12_02165 [Clostridia bacterium]|nr:hypothetical protein [Clostridia bacterium]